MFNVTANSSFNLDFAARESNFATSFYYTQSFIKSNYLLSVSNIKQALGTIELNDDFLQDIFTYEVQLGGYPSEQESYMQMLLTKYDTHFVTGAEFGGDLIINYNAHSNSLSFKKSLSSSAETIAGATIMGEIGSNASVNTSFRQEIYGIDRLSQVNFFAKSRGGNVDKVATENNFQHTFSNWAGTVNCNEVLINFAHLTPIWEVLTDYYYIDGYGNMPLTYYKQKAKEMYNKMLSEKQVAPESYNKDIVRTYNGQTSVEFRVTDAPFLTQNKSIVTNLIDVNGPRLALVKEKDYSKITFTINYEAREINDGYQDYYFYISNRAGDDLKLIKSITKELTPGKRQSEWTKEQIEFVIPISDFMLYSNDIYPYLKIYFGAHGSGKDDWEIKNISYISHIS